jgi:hypothetical protein
MGINFTGNGTVEHLKKPGRTKPLETETQEEENVDGYDTEWGRKPSHEF